MILMAFSLAIGCHTGNVIASREKGPGRQEVGQESAIETTELAIR